MRFITSCTNSGVYAIVNHMSGRQYIGSSKNLRKRYSSHLSDLKRGVHRNSALQSDFLTFGADQFSFLSLEAHPPNEVIEAEQKHLGPLMTHYNTSSIATSSLHVTGSKLRVAPFVDLPGETWRPVVAYAGYEVSSLGRVRSYWKLGTGRGFNTIPRLRKLSVAEKRGGYLTVLLRRSGKSHLRYVHHLVLEAFKGPCPSGMQARHVGVNDVTNNTVSNLEWGTAEANMADKVLHGTSQHGERNHQSKLSDAEADVIRTSALPGWVLAQQFGIAQSQVSRIRNGVRRAKAFH